MSGRIEKQKLLRNVFLTFIVSLNVLSFLGIREQTAIYYSSLQTTIPVIKSNGMDKSPVSAVHRKKAAICVIVKNEELYLDEWVDYHRALGFDGFYIYDNSDDFEMKQWGKLKGNHVRLRHMPGEKSQMLAYIDCHRRIADNGNYEWIAFFDVDEFLVLKRHDHVSDLLEEHCPTGKLGVNWVWFGPNHWNVPVPEPVTRRFVYRDANVAPHVKTIARVGDIHRLHVFKDPHNFVELHKKLKMHDTRRTRFSGPYNPNGPIDVVALHHYNTKSYKEQVAKRHRGRASAPTTDEYRTEAEDSFLGALQTDRLPFDDRRMASDPAYVFDDSAWRFLKTHVPGYALFDEIGLIQPAAAATATDTTTTTTTTTTNTAIN